MTKIFSLLCIPFISLAILFSIFTPLNHATFTALNHVLPAKALWMTITNIGDATFLSCALFISLHNNKRLLSNAIICGIFIHYTIKFTKNFFGIVRPEHTPDLINLITLGPVLKLDNYAMPSGHTASAFMAAIFIASAIQLRGWKLWLMISYACLVGISRIAVGAHWPADVCAGAVIGIFFGLLCTHPKWNFTHIAVQYLTLALYLPFIGIAIHRVKSIHDTTTLINESVMVLAGVVGLAIWLRAVKSSLHKKSPPLTNE